MNNPRILPNYNFVIKISLWYMSQRDVHKEPLGWYFLCSRTPHNLNSQRTWKKVRIMESSNYGVSFLRMYYRKGQPRSVWIIESSNKRCLLFIVYFYWSYQETFSSAILPKLAASIATYWPRFYLSSPSSSTIMLEKLI